MLLKHNVRVSLTLRSKSETVEEAIVERFFGAWPWNGGFRERRV